MALLEWDVAAQNFSAMIGDLARTSGRDFLPVLVNQVGALLKVCLRLTPARPVGEIVKRASRRLNHIEFPNGEVIAVWKKADHAEMYLDESTYPNYAAHWPKTTKLPTFEKGSKSWHQMNDPKRHWNDQRWGRYQELRAMIPEIRRRKVDEAVARRGLAKFSWKQMADALGLMLPVPAYVRRASQTPAGLRMLGESTARSVLEQAAAFVDLQSRNPLLTGKLGGRQIILRALNARLKAFEIETSKGVFSDLAARAKRYPGIFTN